MQVGVLDWEQGGERRGFPQSLNHVGGAIRGFRGRKGRKKELYAGVFRISSNDREKRDVFSWPGAWEKCARIVNPNRERADCRAALRIMAGLASPSLRPRKRLHQRQDRGKFLEALPDFPGTHTSGWQVAARKVKNLAITDIFPPHGFGFLPDSALRTGLRHQKELAQRPGSAAPRNR